MEQSDGTFVAWAGPDESVGVDYVEDTPEHAQAAAMFALKRKSGHGECSPRCLRRSRCGRTRRSNRREGGLGATLQPAVKSRPSSRYFPLSFARAALPASFLGFNCKDFS